MNFFFYEFMQISSDEDKYIALPLLVPSDIKLFYKECQKFVLWVESCSSHHQSPTIDIQQSIY